MLWRVLDTSPHPDDCCVLFMLVEPQSLLPLVTLLCSGSHCCPLTILTSLKSGCEMRSILKITKVTQRTLSPRENCSSPSPCSGGRVSSGLWSRGLCPPLMLLWAWHSSSTFDFKDTPGHVLARTQARAFALPDLPRMPQDLHSWLCL